MPVPSARNHPTSRRRLDPRTNYRFQPRTKSRQVAQLPLLDVGIHPSQQAVQSAGGQVVLHLAVPGTVLPHVQTARDLLPLFQVNLGMAALISTTVLMGQ